MKKMIFSGIVLMLLVLFAEIIAFASFHLLSLDDHPASRASYELSKKHRLIIKELLEAESFYYAVSDSLGWEIEPNADTQFCRSNAAGFRSDKDYEQMNTASQFRITTFGDSFTHCDGVQNDETWQSYIELNSKGVEVLNFGVGGYGLDQAYLRYLHKGSSYDADIVLIGFMSENIFRNVNNFRPFYSVETSIPLSKPRYVIKDGQLELLANPLQGNAAYEKLLKHPDRVLKALGKNDYYYPYRDYSALLNQSHFFKLYHSLIWRIKRRMDFGIVENKLYNETSEAFQVTTLLFDQFHEAVIKSGAKPVILVFPCKEDVLQFRSGDMPRYTPLIQYLQAQNYSYIDLMEAFSGETGLEEHFDGHYSALVNQSVAKHIAAKLNLVRE